MKNTRYIVLLATINLILTCWMLYLFIRLQAQLP
jgi:hypothetical protein